MHELLHEKWRQLLRTWTVDADRVDRCFAEISEHYAELGRAYHTLRHIHHVLDTVENLGEHARNLPAVQLAAWLHDVIYDSRAADNEERSADFAVRLCEETSIPESQRVADLILKTKTHDAGEDIDAQVLLDADLAILGAPSMHYTVYCIRIRQEYAWVSEPDYRQGRLRVLRTFLQRPRIFHFLQHLEGPARANLCNEIARLIDA